MTDDQAALLRDKYVLWERASREGPMDLRDYNRRAAEALKAALMIVSEYLQPAPAEARSAGLSDALKLAADVRWKELAEGSPFTLVDRSLLGNLYRLAAAAHPTPPKAETDHG